MITEKEAWSILDKYVGDCLKIDSKSLLAVYAVGSLGGGYYRPGQSDIDAILIVKNGSESVWGNNEHLSSALKMLNHQYKKRYQIPKDFGPFPLSENELLPPYDLQNSTLIQEIARLKLQGKCVYGKYDLLAVPLPSAEDFLLSLRVFEKWWLDEFVKGPEYQHLSPSACANIILMHVIRFLWLKRGIIEFDKRKLIETYLKGSPDIIDQTAFGLVEEILQAHSLSPEESELLRESALNFRLKMNSLLRVVP